MNSLKFEWKKLLSVKSTWIAALSAVLSSALLGLLGIADTLALNPGDLPLDWDPTAESLKGFIFAQLIIGMFGALAITPEYASGMIGSSVVSVPSRLRLILDKTVAVAIFTYGISLITTAVSFSVVQLALFSAGLPSATLTNPDVLVALVVGSLYLTLIAITGLLLGILLRSSTSALSALVGLTLIIPALAPALPHDLARYWPINAGQAAYQVVVDESSLAPVLGMTVLLVTVAVGWVASQLIFRWRDI